MKGHFGKAFLCLAALSAIALGGISPAEAGKPCKGRGCKAAYIGDPDAYRHVTAEATVGGRMVTAPVRAGPYGDQVLVPGGSWVDCEVTCEYTLRRLTVDFWDGIGPSRTVTPGYFRYDIDLDTGHVYRRGPRILGRY
jgi:hypothetical protein